MTNWIENFQEAKSLYLCWQAPENSGSRTRWAVGMISAGLDGEFELHYFRDLDEFKMHNGGQEVSELERLQFSGFPAFSFRRDHVEAVRETFMRRLPPRKRPDFPEFLEKFRIKPLTEMSDFSLLARTEAKSPGDNFSLVDPLVGYVEPCDFMLEIAGYRHYAAALEGKIRVGQQVTLVLEPANAFDKKAVQVRLGDQCVGYINRLQTFPFEEWLGSKKVTAEIERLNGTTDHPRAFVFLKIR